MTTEDHAQEAVRLLWEGIRGGSISIAQAMAILRNAHCSNKSTYTSGEAERCSAYGLARSAA